MALTKHNPIYLIINGKPEEYLWQNNKYQGKYGYLEIEDAIDIANSFDKDFYIQVKKN